MANVIGPSSANGLPSGFKYWGFISYSHTDEKVAARLHRELEQYRVPKALVGQEGRAGLIPKKLFPIFRDRDELAASADLSSAILTALSESVYLIVICSPAATQSRWVNEEVLTFKRLGREDRILAVIASGEPMAKNLANECFPLALRQKLGADGERLHIPAEPIAADMRPQGDGKEGYKLKLVAGLLGVSLNDLRHRELIAARKRARVSQVVAVAMLLLTIVAVAGGWMAYKNQQKAERRLDVAIDIASGVVQQAVDMSEKFGVPQRAIGGLLDWAQRSFSALSKEDLPDKLKHRQASTLMVFSSQYAVAGNADKQLAAAQLARDLLAPLIKADPSNSEWQSTFSAIHGQIGDAYRAQGRFADALVAYQQALAVDERLLANGPSDPERLEAVAARLERIGTDLALEGNLQESLSAQEKSLSIAKRLAAEHPSERGKGQTLAIQYEKVGELQARLNKADDALESYLSSLHIRSPLAQQDPNNTTYQRDLGGELQQDRAVPS
jgi:tetratricopeptide (TPR) repeat protein